MNKNEFQVQLLSLISVYYFIIGNQLLIDSEVPWIKILNKKEMKEKPYPSHRVTLALVE